MRNLWATAMLIGVILLVAMNQTTADEKTDKAKASAKKKVMKQLGTKADGFFLIALEEVSGQKVNAVSIVLSEGRDAAADAIAEHLVGVTKPKKRTFQVVARLEPNQSAIAGMHRKNLQKSVDNRLKDPVFSLDPCYSDLSPSSGKSLNQKLAEGIAVRYLPLR